MRIRIPLVLCSAALLSVVASPAIAQKPSAVEYRVLATSKTSTMQKEMQEAAAAGFRYGDVMGGDTAFGGSEVVVIMHRDGSVVAILERTVEAPNATKYEYRLVATKKTSTMQKELGEAGDQGFEFVGMTVAKTLVGGDEVVAIVRRKL